MEQSAARRVPVVSWFKDRSVSVQILSSVVVAAVVAVVVGVVGIIGLTQTDAPATSMY